MVKILNNLSCHNVDVQGHFSCDATRTPLFDGRQGIDLCCSSFPRVGDICCTLTFIILADHMLVFKMYWKMA